MQNNGEKVWKIPCSWQREKKWKVMYKNKFFAILLMDRDCGSQGTSERMCHQPERQMWLCLITHVSWFLSLNLLAFETFDCFGGTFRQWVTWHHFSPIFHTFLHFLTLWKYCFHDEEGRSASIQQQSLAQTSLPMVKDLAPSAKKNPWNFGSLSSLKYFKEPKEPKFLELFYWCRLWVPHENKANTS